MALLDYLSQSDNLIQVSGLKDHLTGEFVNDADVAVTLTDLDEQELAGETWPRTMEYVAGSSGKYRTVLNYAIAAEVGDIIYAVVTAVTDSGRFRRRIKIKVIE